MRQLAEICLDLWLLGQRAAGDGLPDGHRFQRAVADALGRPGTRRAAISVVGAAPAT